MPDSLPPAPYCCPENRTSLTPASAHLIAALNERIALGTLVTIGGRRIATALDGGLVRADGTRLYPTTEGIAALVADEAVALPV